MILQFVLSNFGPLIAFYGVNHFWGLKPAVASAVAWTIGEIAYNRIKRIPTSTFFKFSAAVAILFGAIDIYLRQSVFFKYEASLTNLVSGFYFASTLWGAKPLIQEFAEKQGRMKGDLTPDRIFYFRFLTWVWAIYLWIKAGAYYWLASRVSLEQGLAVRFVLGNASFYGLLAASIFGGKYMKTALARLKLLPSSRAGSGAVPE